MACPSAPGNTAGGAAADAPAPSLAQCGVSLGKSLGPAWGATLPQSSGMDAQVKGRECRGSTRLGEQSQGLRQRQLSSSSPEVFGAENNEPCC